MTVLSIDASEPTAASRYLAGQLSDVERAAFEARLRDDPAVVREVEATARLKVGLARLRERGELDELLEPRAWSPRWFGLATAAALVMIVMGIMLSRVGPEAGRPPMLAAQVSSLLDAKGTVLPIASTFAVLRKRSESYDATVQAAPAGAVEMRVFPETPAEAGRYRVTLARMNGENSFEPVASVDGLRQAADGFITLYVDSARLVPGRYRLAVVADVRNGDDSVADSFLIRVLPSRND